MEDKKLRIEDYLKVIELSKAEAAEVFNQGNFNDIFVAYAVMALRNIGIDSKTIELFEDELHRCFDEYTAQEILQKIKTQ